MIILHWLILTRVLFYASRGAAPSVYDLIDEATGVIRMVGCWCFQLMTSECRESSFGQLSVGDIVGVRRIYTDMKTHEVLAYSCPAMLKAYFAQIKGFFPAPFISLGMGCRLSD